MASVSINRETAHSCLSIEWPLTICQLQQSCSSYVEQQPCSSFTTNVGGKDSGFGGGDTRIGTLGVCPSTKAFVSRTK